MDPVQYQVLLLITDGVVGDMQNTVDKIVEGSGLPLSIVIVGVGTADFGPMVRVRKIYPSPLSPQLRWL